MNASRLQEPFFCDWVMAFRATYIRTAKRQAAAVDQPARDAVLLDELRGLYHGLLVTFDGGSCLADQGLINIVDEDGVAFDRFLHEICFRYWPDASAT